MSTITLSPGAQPPDLRLLGGTSPSGLVGGRFNLRIVGGATYALLNVYGYTAAIEVLDSAAFAKLATPPALGWGAPQIASVNAGTPTPFSGGAGTSEYFPPGTITSSAQPPFPEPAPRWDEVGLPAWAWTGCAPRVPFVRPKPIAYVSSGPLFLQLVSSDTGGPVTFEVTSS